MPSTDRKVLSGPEHAHYDNTAYMGCKTRIVDLQHLSLPNVASDEEYRRIYREYVKTKSAASALLERAVNSVTTGIAPPVAFPTETVYGLGADATNQAAVAGIFAAKGRPSDNPLIVHVSSAQHLGRLLGGEDKIPAVYHDLIKEYWPGPLTILLPLPDKHNLAPNVHPGQTTVGFRVPLSKYARFFIAAADRPIAGPSANSSGKPSPTTAQHVMKDMQGKINFILDGGCCDVGVESTVVDGLGEVPLILRPGGLSRLDLMEHGNRFGNSWARVQLGYDASDEVGVDRNLQSLWDAVPKSITTNGCGNSQEASIKTDAPKAPGMKYKHYAPQARMILFVPSTRERTNGASLHGNSHAALDFVRQEMQARAASSVEATKTMTIAVLTTTRWPEFVGLRGSRDLKSHRETDGQLVSFEDPGGSLFQARLHNIPLGGSARVIANRLFAALRTCDDLKCDLILAEAPSPVHDGDESLYEFETVLERMRKAASEVVGD